MNVSELEGAHLDAAVARAEGYDEIEVEKVGHKLVCQVVMPGEDGESYWTDYAPSKEWETGGPIIEREKLMVQPLLLKGHWYGEWRSVGLSWEGRTHADEEGPSPLVAAMRAYVASKEAA